MSSKSKNLSVYDESTIPDSSKLKVGIVVADWNADITHALYDGCLETLIKHGVKKDEIHTAQVPGAFELPSGAKMLAGHQALDAIICLGCVIKGETAHDVYINTAVANGLMNMSIVSGKPVIFGLLTPNDKQQALDRSGGKYGNKGVEAAVTALRMAHLKDDLKGVKKSIGF